VDLQLAAIVIMGGWVVAILLAGLVLALRPGGAAVKLTVATPISAKAGVQREVILLGAEAETHGNPRGRVQAIRLRKGGWQIQAIVLGDGLGVVASHLPADAIVSADGSAVELADESVDTTAETSSDDAVTLSAGMSVASVDRKRIGRLRLVSFDPASYVVTALVVEGPTTPASLRLLPTEHVTSVGPDGIATDIKRAAWMTLDAYASDWDLRQLITERIDDDRVLQPFARSITIDVQDQRVRLRGYVATQDQIDRAAQISRSVPGVLAIERAIVSDDALAEAVTRAIGQNPRTSRARVQVTAHFGVLDIAGEVPDVAVMKAIEQVANQVPGVQGVHNMVAVRSVAQSA
jgi:osmotically-inducible protein OsmY